MHKNCDFAEQSHRGRGPHSNRNISDLAEFIQRHLWKWKERDREIASGRAIEKAV